jgi:RNA polymerase sigma-70 factor (ECF subfamily)
VSDRIGEQPAVPSVLTSENSDRLDRLFRLYSKRVLAYAVTRAKRSEDAHDIAGDAWVLACRYIHGLRADDDHAMPWLASVVRTAARNHYRPRRASEQPRDWTDAVASRRLPASPAAESVTDVFALAELTAVQVVAVKLAAQGVSQRAIARRLGRKQQHVCTSIHAGARRLRSSMAGVAA